MENQEKDKDSPSIEKDLNENKDLTNIKKGPISLLSGSITSFFFSFILYLLSQRIVIYFYSHRPSNSSEIVMNISASINTLIIGLSFLATFSFAFIGLGLFIVFIRSFFVKK